MSAAEMLWWLLVAHALTDFPLQGDFLAKAKNHVTPVPGVPWYTALAAHALISGGGVALVTGSLLAGIMETLVHAFIDHGKNSGRFGFNTDQALHVACKAAWVLALVSR